MIKKKIAATALTLVSLLVLVFLLLVALGSGPYANGPPLFKPPLKEQLLAELNARFIKQARVDDMLLAELDSGAYSFEEPLAIVDPYGTSPLAALVLFTSGEPLNISVHVPGTTAAADVDFTFDGYNTSHMIPVYGLYPDKLNRVKLTAKTQSGGEKEIFLELQTEPLGLDLADHVIQTDIAQPDKVQPGFNFTFARKTAFDVNGDYRWYYNDFLAMQATLYNYNGNIVCSKGDWHGDCILFEINSLGKVLSAYVSPYGAHHDITATGDENLLVTGSQGKYIEDFLYEFDVKNGMIVNKLDFRPLLQRTRTVNWPIYLVKDWLHINSVVYDRGSIIISAKTQSAVVKLSWPEGEIEWLLADPADWNPNFRPYLLTPVGEGFEWPYCQHSPEILPDFDNNPDTLDILLFDNGNTRYNEKFQWALDNKWTLFNKKVEVPERYSRLVHYRINEKEKTIEQIRQFGKELGASYYSDFCGDANLLANGNWLGSFEREFTDIGDAAVYGDFSATAIEVDPSGGTVWTAFCENDSPNVFYTYRLERHPMYNAAANDLRVGVHTNVLVLQENPAQR